jgi:hypothetical protein
MAIARNRPTVNADSSAVAVTPTRTGSYLEAYVLPLGLGRTFTADEGSYFTGCNPTLGTAIVGHVAPAIADTDTKSILHIFNPTTNTKSIYMDYIWLKQTVVNASSTASDYLVYIDNGGVTARSSGGTAITLQNSRADITTASGATVYFGAVATAATVSRKIYQRTVRPVISVAEDQYVFYFGDRMALPSSQALTGSSVASVACSWGPVVIPPGCNFKFVQTGPSGAATGSTFEFDFGLWER